MLKQSKSKGGAREVDAEMHYRICNGAAWCILGVRVDQSSDGRKQRNNLDTSIIQGDDRPGKRLLHTEAELSTTMVKIVLKMDRTAFQLARRL